MFLGSFRAMKRKQLFWAALCALSLLDVVSGDGDSKGTSTAKTSATNTSITTSPVTLLRTADDNTTKAGPADTTPSSPAGTRAPPSTKNVSINGTTLKMANVTEAPSPPPTTTACSYVGSNATEPGATNISSTQQLEVSSFSTMTLPNTTLKSAWTATTGSTKHTVSSVTMSPGNEISNGTESITCHSVKHVTKPHVICLQLNAPYTCDDFKTKVGRRLWQLLCNDPLASHPTSPCHVELAKSDVKPYCMLLILGDTADAKPILNQLKISEPDLKELGIKSYRKEETRNHQDFSRKTLIALVTSGLSVAILGLAAYFLMKRRSWSPMRERLGEDPYYMENSSQGNTLISAGAHEQPEPQEKPNLKGGAQENGTGQTASKNGRSAKPHVLADTEM